MQGTYLVERVLDDALPVSVWDARKQIPYSCVSLRIYVLLLLWNGLR